MKQKRGDAETRRHSKADTDRRVSLSGVITLTTDFGTADYFVGAMKGVILSASPETQIIDITHEIPPQDVSIAAFIVLTAYSHFPLGTIHVAVVDPGVGSMRRGIVVQTEKQFFVGPDNGIFSYIYDREQEFKVFALTNEKYFLTPVSATFHGRDIFAPVAAALAKGLDPETLGKRIDDPVRLPPLSPRVTKSGLSARIINIDRFGNCITNISQQDLGPEATEAGAVLLVKGRRVSSFRNFFSEATSDKSQVFCIWGSAGFLEIVATNRSAAKLLKAKVGTAVVVRRRK